MIAEDLILQCKKRTVDWGLKEWEQIKKEGNEIYAALAQFIEKDLGPRSEEVQSLIHQHYKMIMRFMTPPRMFMWDSPSFIASIQDSGSFSMFTIQN